MITSEGAKNILEGLRMIQYGLYDYNEFLKILKKRIMRYTGDNSVMFLNEKNLVLELGRLGVLQDLNNLNKKIK